MKSTEEPRRTAAGLGDLALAAARVGGREVLAQLTDGTARRSWATDGRHDRDPVTAADLASDEAIRTHVRAVRPQDSWLTEETGHTAGTSGLCWVVDPLDGTVNATHGIDRFAVSVAVQSERDGEVAAAAVLSPTSGDWLLLSGGVVTGSRQAGVTEPHPRRALISFAVPSSTAVREMAYTWLGAVASRVQDLRNSGSTVSDLADVATGRLDGFVSIDPKPWDVAAGLALVRGAGGTDRRWRRPDGRVVLVAGGADVVAAVNGWLGG